MSFRATRNAGFLFLLCIIFAICFLSFINFSNILSALNSVTSYETPVREKTDLIIRILTEAKNSFEIYILRDKTDCIDVIDNIDLLITESLNFEQLLGNKSDISDLFKQKVNASIDDNHNKMFSIIDLTQLMMLIGLIVGILFAVIAAVVTSRSLMKPIAKLVDATRNMSTGDLNYRIKEIPKDEIGKLAVALNQMAEKLQRITVSRDKLRKTQAQLIQASKLASIGELAAGIAHELNQPLMVIRTGIQMIERSISKKRIDLNSILEDMKLFDRNTNRMVKIISHLRTFSRQSNTDFEPININQVIEDALSMITEQLRVRNITLSTTYSPNLFKIHGNGNQLEQVILNLLTNARDAIEDKNDNARKITINTENSDDGSTVNIYIKDSGKGISSDAIEHIFNPFYTTKEVGKGTGLGLSISYGIIKDHHGEIFVLQTGNSGTTFGISLPVFSLNACS
jgi:C4-dicarboxylate-specific signal transduction histidine kinase